MHILRSKVFRSISFLNKGRYVIDIILIKLKLNKIQMYEHSNYINIRYSDSDRALAAFEQTKFYIDGNYYYSADYIINIIDNEINKSIGIIKLAKIFSEFKNTMVLDGVLFWQCFDFDDNFKEYCQIANLKINEINREYKRRSDEKLRFRKNKKKEYNDNHNERVDKIIKKEQTDIKYISSFINSKGYCEQLQKYSDIRLAPHEFKITLQKRLNLKINYWN